MRKTMIVAGTVLVLGLAFTGCDNNGGGDDTPPVVNPPVPAPGATQLNLTGRVYASNWDDEFFPTFTPFPTGQNRTVWSWHGGAGTIANGQLSFTIATPTSLSPIENEIWLLGGVFDPPNAQAARLWLSTRTAGGTQNTGELELMHFSGSVSGNSFSHERVDRLHMYVDRDVVVRMAQDWTETETWTEDDGTIFNTTYTARAFTITLRQGWNTVHYRLVSTGTFVGTVENPTSVTMTTTETVSIADPGRQLRWSLYEWDSHHETLDLSRDALPRGLGASPFRTRR